MDRRTLDHIARLARLGIEESHRSRYEGQLAAIFQHFGELSQLATDQVDESTRAVDDAVRTRADEARAQGADGVSLVAAAPDHDARNYRVPRVLE